MFDFLPIGSVVLLRQGNSRVMITGRCQKDKGSGATFDYVGCPFPAGIQSAEAVTCFNKDSIVLVFSLGYQNEEELLLRRELKNVWGDEKK